MTILYRTILFTLLACYGWYYNAHLNAGSLTDSAQAHVDSARPAVHGGAQ